MHSPGKQKRKRISNMNSTTSVNRKKAQGEREATFRRRGYINKVASMCIQNYNTHPHYNKYKSNAQSTTPLLLSHSKSRKKGFDCVFQFKATRKGRKEVPCTTVVCVCDALLR
jgi:hypothetical protein